MYFESGGRVSSKDSPGATICAWAGESTKYFTLPKSGFLGSHCSAAGLGEGRGIFAKRYFSSFTSNSAEHLPFSTGKTMRTEKDSIFHARLSCRLAFPLFGTIVNIPLSAKNEKLFAPAASYDAFSFFIGSLNALPSICNPPPNDSPIGELAENATWRALNSGGRAISYFKL